MLYRTLVQPYCDYCNIVCVLRAGPHCLKVSFVIQKKAVRLISYAKWNAHTSTLFRKLKKFLVHEINKFQIRCIVYKSLNCLLPNSFVITSAMRDRDTRQRIKLHVILH